MKLICQTTRDKRREGKMCRERGEKERNELQEDLQGGKLK